MYLSLFYHGKGVIMVSKHIVIGIIIFLCMSCVAFAERTLDREEILEIFDKLTDQSRETWISAGTIEAIHDEYRAAKTTNQARISNQISREIREYQTNSKKTELPEELKQMKLEAIPFNVRYELSNEYSMNSNVVIKYDGERFSWEIGVNSRTDSVVPGKELEGNFMTEQFDLDWNAERIFAWDGRKFTFYSVSGNQAIVDEKGDFPNVVNGPLTAGIVPWGYGRLSYDELSASKATAVEVDMDGRTEIHLTINNSDGTEMLFIMEPEKNYAVLSCLFTGRDSINARQYDNFRLISGTWIPTTMLIEEYDDLANDPLASDLWMFTRISSAIPKLDSFRVDYKSNALVEYRSLKTEKSLIYHYADNVDIERVLSEVSAVAASEGSLAMQENCATVALDYAAQQLGKEVADKRLTRLVSESDSTTSLYTMKQFVQSLGLHCRVVKTDIETLKKLSDCKAILHLPKKEHFVLVDHIDDKDVWIFDLAGNKFFYSADINSFAMDWNEGTALLISRQPIQLKGNFSEIADAQLHSFIGADGYTCTRLLQRYNVVYCDKVGEICAGYYEVYFTRYGCEHADSGTCTMGKFASHVSTPCINDPYYPMNCTAQGSWTYYHMRACK
jgi:hypothetical protein